MGLGGVRLYMPLERLCFEGLVFVALQSVRHRLNLALSQILPLAGPCSTNAHLSRIMVLQSWV